MSERLSQFNHRSPEIREMARGWFRFIVDVRPDEKTTCSAIELVNQYTTRKAAQ